MSSMFILFFLQTALCNSALENPLYKTREQLTNAIIHFLETDTIWYAPEFHFAHFLLYSLSSGCLLSGMGDLWHLSEFFFFFKLFRVENIAFFSCKYLYFRFFFSFPVPIHVLYQHQFL